MDRLPALGMIETTGITGLIAAADAAAKAADVRVITWQRADAGIVTVYVIGDVASVQAAVQAGEAEACRVGHCRSAHVIPRPDISVLRQVGYSNASELEANSEPEEKSGSGSRSEAGTRSKVEMKAETGTGTKPDPGPEPETNQPNKRRTRKGRR